MAGMSHGDGAEKTRAGAMMGAEETAVMSSTFAYEGENMPKGV
jgi:hypothetical protein